MSQLIIADLNFFEIEFPGKSEVKGGNNTPVVSAAVDAGVDAALDARLKVNGTQYEFSGGTASAVGGAAAGSTEGPVSAKVNVVAKVNLS